MSTEPTWGRALSRYGDRIYRLALVRDPDPERAVAATTAAFRAIDWSTTTLDEQLETRLFAAMPPAKRDLRWSLRRHRPSSLLPGLPAAFWALPAPTRLGLALRLTRGYSTEAIATALAQPLDEVRSRLLVAIGLLAGDPPAELAEACRRCRLARLDDPAAERRHVIECAACQGSIPRWEQSEEKLALALAQATGALRLPRASVEALADELSLGPPAAHAGRRWRRPELLQATLVLVVVFAIMALILPQRNATQGARAPTTARGLLEASLGRYGAPPEGEGVVHRRYRFALDTPQGDYLAETWTDAAQPARHRMQLSTGKQLMEWQTGDGERKLRYAARTNQFCGAQYDSEMLALGKVNSWDSDSAQQAAQRAARWSFGPWALGRRYLEQALAADTVRSLGVVADDEGTVITLAADGRAISGTLLLTLDGATGDLREVRAVADDNGQTRARTAWQLLDEQRIALPEARKAAIFTGSPWTSEFRELKREQPILDPACPLLRDENLLDPATSVAMAYPPLYGLATLPAGTSHMFVAGYRQSGSLNPYMSPFASLVYVGPGKRLVIQAGALPAFKLPEEGMAGEWVVRIRNTSAGGWEGEAGSLVDAGRQDWRAFAFSAEGWARDELETALARVRVLSLADALAEELPFGPGSVPPAVGKLVLATGLLDSRADRAFHAVVEYQMRADPDRAPLSDPYHARSLSGTTDILTAYGPNGEREKFRWDFRPSDAAQNYVQWGDGDGQQIYFPDLGVFENFPNMFNDPLRRVDYALRNVFRYRIYERSEEGGEHVTLSTTLPLTETHYAEDFLSQVQQQRSTNQNTPWMADLKPETITFRLRFDRASGQLRTTETWANVDQRAVLLERLTLHSFEEVEYGVGNDWDFQAPPGTPAIDVNFSGAAAPTTRTITNRADLLAAAPTGLWGWNDDAIRFVEAEAPYRNFAPTYYYQTLHDAVRTGAAAEITWDHPTLLHFTTIQGQMAYMRLVLQQTPAEWTESRAIRLTIAGKSREAWVMRGDNGQRWVIMELGETLIVAQYQGQEPEHELLAALQDLEPLRPEVVLNRNLPMPIRCSSIQDSNCVLLGGTAVPLEIMPSDD